MGTYIQYRIKLNESSITNTCRASYIKLWNNTHYIGIFILFLLNKEGRGGVGGGVKESHESISNIGKVQSLLWEVVFLFLNH